MSFDDDERRQNSIASFDRNGSETKGAMVPLLLSCVSSHCKSLSFVMLVHYSSLVLFILPKIQRNTTVANSNRKM
jgi:hypothetical protein